MLKRIKNLLKDNIFSIAILITISIAYLSLIKMPNYPSAISHTDKLKHLLAYFVLTMCWLISFYSKVPSKKYFIVIACIIYGIIIEVLQSELTNYRTGDYLDVLANTIGVLLALSIFNRFFKKNRVNLQ